MCGAGWEGGGASATSIIKRQLVQRYDKLCM